jgi:hypothetical protein
VILTTYVSKIGDIEKLIYAKNYKFLFNENFLISMFIMLKLSVNRETKICFKKKNCNKGCFVIFLFQDYNHTFI